MTQEDLYWYWLNNIPGIGRKTITELLKLLKTPRRIYQASRQELVPGVITENRWNALKASRDMEKLQSSCRRMEESHVAFLHPEDAGFPDCLKQIPDMPYGLYYKGKMPDSGAPSVAVIGARSCSRYGLEMAYYYARELAACGISIISGLARGIDARAHEGALAAGGYTMGVVAGGLDRVYPVENYDLFMRLAGQGGILSESNLGITPVAGLFPQRNRLISGLADGILVVEAREKSGTFITVDQGLDQGKEVFAIPGRVTDPLSAGCNRLIAQGAHIVTAVEDILDILQIPTRNSQDFAEKQADSAENTAAATVSEHSDTGKTQSAYDSRNGQKTRKFPQPVDISQLSLAPVEKMVYSCLRIEPQYLDELIGEMMLAPQEVCRALNRLVMCGAAVETTRNYYAVRLK